MNSEILTPDERERLEQRRDQCVTEQLTQARNLDTTISDAAARIIAEKVSGGRGALAEFARTGEIDVEAVKVELGVGLALEESEEAQQRIEALAEYVMAQPADGREPQEDWDLLTDIDTGEQYGLAAEHLGDVMTPEEWQARYVGTYADSREAGIAMIDQLGYAQQLEVLLESSEIPDDVQHYIEINAEALLQQWWITGEIAILHMDDGRVVILNNRAF